MNLMTPGILIREVVEALIDEYKNAEKLDFVNWNANDIIEEEDDDVN